MKEATVTCMERGKTKTYTGELIGRDFGGIHIWIIGKGGSGQIKFIKTDRILHCVIEGGR